MVGMGERRRTPAMKAPVALVAPEERADIGTSSTPMTSRMPISSEPAKISWFGAFKDSRLEEDFRAAEVRPSMLRQAPRVALVFALGFLAAEVRALASTDGFPLRSRLAIVGMVLMVVVFLVFVAAGRGRWPMPTWAIEAIYAGSVAASVMLVVFMDELERQSGDCTSARALQVMVGLVVVSVAAPGTQPLPFAGIATFTVVSYVAANPEAALGSLLALRDFAILAVGVGFIVRGRALDTAFQRGRYDFSMRAEAALLEVRTLAQAEAETQVRVLSAEAASQARSRLIRAVFHNLRSPLISVVSLVDGLRPHTPPAEPGQSAYSKKLRILEACGRTMENIICDMLDFERIDSGRLAFSMRSFSPLDVLESCQLVFATPMADQQLAFTVEPLGPDLDGAQMLGDAARITQALQNGLSNALKFTDAGGSVTLRLWCEDAEAPADDEKWHTQPARASTPAVRQSSTPRSQLLGATLPPNDSPVMRRNLPQPSLAKPPVPTDGPGRWVWLYASVSDTGAGAEAAEVEGLNADVPFNERVGKGQMEGRGGAGLGISIARSLVQAHGGGSLTIQSPGPGQGLVFQMRVRCKVLKGAEPAAAAAAAPSALGSDSSLTKGSLLGQPAAQASGVRASRASSSSTTHRVSGISHVPGSSAHVRCSYALMDTTPASSSSPTDVATADGAAAAAGASQPRCLHVDDDTFVRLTLPPRIFEPLGCAYDTAANGVEAERMILSRPGGYVLVLMDNQMPEATGEVCVRQVRAAGYAGPIVGMTGDPVGSEDRARFEAAGLDACVDKTTEGVDWITNHLRGLLRAHAASHAASPAAATALAENARGDAVVRIDGAPPRLSGTDSAAEVE